MIAYFGPLVLSAGIFLGAFKHIDAVETNHRDKTALDMANKNASLIKQQTMEETVQIESAQNIVDLLTKEDLKSIKRSIANCYKTRDFVGLTRDVGCTVLNRLLENNEIDEEKYNEKLGVLNNLDESQIPSEIKELVDNYDYKANGWDLMVSIIGIINGLICIGWLWGGPSVCDSLD